jgi:hypothetical protein
MEFPHTDVEPRALSRYPHAKGPAHELLGQFVGHWSVQGTNPLASVEASDITGVETIEWLIGEHFLEYRWDRVLAFGWHHGVGMIGYDVEEESHFAHFYDNLGFTRRYHVEVLPGRMTFAGPYERGELTLEANGRRLAIHWERATDSGWKKLCDLTGTRTA